MKLNFNLVLPILLLGISGLLAQNTPEKKKDSVVMLPEVTLEANVLFGSAFEARNRTGSAHFISTKELKLYQFTDLQRLLQSVPGINAYEEDGFGLRPNISLRGTSPERSAKITMMEDGVLIAPAPYSASAAYYIPVAARMQSIEVLKGSSQIQYGPFTTGGAINLVSLGIPQASTGRVQASYGGFGNRLLEVNQGGRIGGFGYVIQGVHQGSNGFKEMPYGLPTGYDLNDFMGKLSYDWTSGASKQSLQVKYQQSAERADETYLGLTEADFAKNPRARYLASSKDLMDTDHQQWMLSHTLAYSDFGRLTTTVYRNNFGRNWYKINDVIAQGEKKGIATVVADPIAFPNHYTVLNGNAEAGDLILVKANNRQYSAQGIQTKWDHHWISGSAKNDIELGLRIHRDDEDRFQWVDQYSINPQGMNLVQSGTPGTDANQITTADATAAYALYKWKKGAWSIVPGLRMESIKMNRENFGKQDTQRTGNALVSNQNSVTEWIPGIGMTYRLNPDISFFGGVHQGFSPPSNTQGVDVERSVNYEWGTRIEKSNLSTELALYFNDFSNLLGSDTAASGGTGNLDPFNAGAVDVYGLEWSAVWSMDWFKQFPMQLSANYTWTQSSFQSSFNSASDIWGVVAQGDELPYIAKHQGQIQWSAQYQKWNGSLRAHYQSDMRTQSGTGPIPPQELIPSRWVMDAQLTYLIAPGVQLKTVAQNLTNNNYMVSRVPAGLRPGIPFHIMSGITWQW